MTILVTRRWFAAHSDYLPHPHWNRRRPKTTPLLAFGAPLQRRTFKEKPRPACRRKVFVGVRK